MLTLISKFTQFKRNLQKLVQDLLTSDGFADIEESTARRFYELKLVRIKNIQYEFTKKGEKALLKALKQSKTVSDKS